MTALVLRELTVADEAAFEAAVREFAEHEPQWEFAFDFDEGGDFADYVARLDREKRGIALPKGRVPATYLVACLGERIVGRVSVRHTLNDFLRTFGGHIGYGVVPSHRRRGIATQLLRKTLPLTRRLGLDRVLLTCADDNVGSIKTIERCGGVLEDRVARADGSLTRRYWIDLATSPTP